MRVLSWILVAVGLLPLVGIAMVFIVTWLTLRAEDPAYHDTYYVSVSIGWPTLLLISFALTCLGSGLWLRTKSKAQLALIMRGDL